MNMNESFSATRSAPLEETEHNGTQWDTSPGGRPKLQNPEQEMVNNVGNKPSDFKEQ